MRLHTIVLQGVMVLGLLACGYCSYAGMSAGVQADFWVAPDGRDTDPGTKSRPFGTLARARDAVRALRQAEPDRDILVLFRNGTYPIEGPVDFSPEDSGRAGGGVTYAAAPGTKPVISGGRRISGFEPCGDGIWKTTVPEVRDGKWRIEQLYVNGCRAVRARTPNGHYAYMENTVETGFDPVTGKSGQLNGSAFMARAKDIAPLLKLPPERLRDIVVSVAAFGGALLWDATSVTWLFERLGWAGSDMMRWMQSVASPALNLVVASVLGLLGTLYFAIWGRDLRS